MYLSQVWGPMQNLVNSLASVEDLKKQYQEKNRLLIQPALVEKNEWCDGRQIWSIPSSCSSAGAHQIDLSLRSGPPRDCVDLNSERCKHNKCLFVGDWDAEMKYHQDSSCEFTVPFSGSLTYSRSSAKSKCSFSSLLFSI